MRFGGVIPILQTPFSEDDTLDCGSLRREVEFACQAGADGVAFPGFASEWWKLSEAEQDQAAEIIIECAASRLPVILNITAQSTLHAIQQGRRFRDMGCRALMCLPPFLGGGSPGEVFEHLAALLDALPFPFILQYSPSLTGTRLELEQLRELERRFPHLVSIKVDAVPSGPMIGQLVAEFGRDRFTYLVGFAGLQLVDALARGAQGLMGGCGHLPEDVAVFRALTQGSLYAEDQFCLLLPLLNFEMQTINQSIATHKYLLQKRGIFQSDRLRAPGSPLDSTHRQELYRHWNRIASLREADV